MANSCSWLMVCDYWIHVAASVDDVANTSEWVAGEHEGLPIDDEWLADRNTVDVIDLRSSMCWPYFGIVHCLPGFLFYAGFLHRCETSAVGCDYRFGIGDGFGAAVAGVLEHGFDALG